ncbi:hypothetical protein PUW25_26410 (plasmid) [Paenibacillus urinalis]|uniref:F5/8 type C domain-containing protein n=1 Tax=Paenibacillus urinalis TaxID=521520 RepID=A0ABY7XGY1_9BACL|nr:hypothetical protein [Paenibacillus urinalis]WDI05106.1 hypothetical protein PUW25_26410 [Paenibacillus urinalis]
MEEYMASGSWTSEVIDLGDNYKSYMSLNPVISIPDGFDSPAKTNVLIADSPDGIQFSDFRAADSGIAVQRYIRFRIELSPGVLITGNTDIDSVTFKDEGLSDLNLHDIGLKTTNGIMKRILDIDTVSEHDSGVNAIGVSAFLNESTIILKRIVGISAVESSNQPEEISSSGSSYFIKGDY